MDQHPVDTLIDTALAGTQGRALYDAYDRCKRAMTNDRGQVLDVRTNAALDVLERALLFPRPLTTDERSLLEGLRTS